MSNQFTFANTRPVDVTLSADSKLFTAHGTAGVEITSEGGKLLFQGPIRAGQPVLAHLALPAKDQGVQVTFRTHGVEKKGTLDVGGGSAAYTFQ